MTLQEFLDKIANSQVDTMIDPRTCEVSFEVLHDAEAGDLLNTATEVRFAPRGLFSARPRLVILVGDEDTINEGPEPDPPYTPGPRKARRK